MSFWDVSNALGPASVVGQRESSFALERDEEELITSKITSAEERFLCHLFLSFLNENARKRDKLSSFY